MIEEEREKRAVLKVEEEAQRLTERARLTTAADVRFKEAVDVATENRSFINKLKIPEYLQAIVEEEQRNGVYVLWWLKYPGLEDAHGAGCFYSEVAWDDNPDRNKSRLVYKEPLFTRISLVWNLGYVESYVQSSRSEYVETGRGTYGYRAVGGGYFPDGYVFKSIDVDGSSKAGLLIICGKQIYRRANTSWEDRGRTYYNEFDLIESSQTVLRSEQLDQPEILKQALASTYLDTLECRFHYKVKGTFHSGSWPFDKQVPEQKQKSRVEIPDLSRSYREKAEILELLH